MFFTDIQRLPACGEDAELWQEREQSTNGSGTRVEEVFTVVEQEENATAVQPVGDFSQRLQVRMCLHADGCRHRGSHGIIALAVGQLCHVRAVCELIS